MIDSHCHLDDPTFADDIDDVLARARDAGVAGFVVPCVRPDRQDALLGLIAKHTDIFATTGIHPWVATELGGDAAGNLLASLERRVKSGVVAIGEVGLDRSAAHAASQAEQETLLRVQLEMARAEDLPVILHVVRAHGRLLEILRSDGLPAPGGVVHGFAGSAELAREYLSLGLCLSFGSRLLDPSSRKARAAVAVVPQDRLLVETDAPFQHPHDSSLRNEPTLLLEVVDNAAEIRDESPADLGAIVAENARHLFALPR